MASVGGDGDDPPDGNSTQRFPEERSHHDGQDLRIVVANGNYDRPEWWPPQDAENNLPNLNRPNERNTIPAKGRETLVVDISDSDWKHIQYGITIVGIAQMRAKKGSMTTFQGFESQQQYRFWLHTHVAKHCQEYFQYRMNPSTHKRTPDATTMLRRIYDDCLDGSDFVQKLNSGKFPIIEEVLKADQVAIHTTGVNTIAAAFVLMTAEHARVERHPQSPDHWPAACGKGEWTDHRLGFSMNDWLRSIFAVLDYYNDRKKAQDHGTVYQFDQKRETKPAILHWGWVSKDIAQAGKPLEGDQVIGLGKPQGTQHTAIQSPDQKSPEEVQLMRQAKEALTAELEAAYRNIDAVKIYRLSAAIEDIVADIHEAESYEPTHPQDQHPLSDEDQKFFIDILNRAIHGVVVGECCELVLPDGSVLGNKEDKQGIMFETHNDALLSIPTEADNSAEKQAAEAGDIVSSDQVETEDAKARAHRRKAAYVSSTAIMSGEAHVNYASLEECLLKLGIRPRHKGDTEYYFCVPTDRMGRNSSSDGGQCFYKVHQLIEIATMIWLVRGPLRFAFLACDCGVGKTVIYTGLIVFLNAEDKRNVDNGQQHVFRPSLVLTLAGLVHQTVQAMRRFFGSTLDIYKVYGTAKEERDVTARDMVLEKEDFVRHYDNLDTRRPSTGRVVYVSSYTTFQARHSKSKFVSTADMSSRDLQRYNITPQDVGLDNYPEESDEDAQDGDENAGAGRKSKPKKRKKKRAAKPKSDKGHKDIEVTRVDQKFHFHVLIADEAHSIRNELSKLTKVVNSIPADIRVLSSATPLMNHPRDIISYQKFGVLDALPDLSYIDTYIPANMDLKNIYADKIDPYEPIGRKGYKDVIGLEHPGDEMVTNTFLKKDSDDPMEQELCRLYEEEGFMWWKLHPKVLRNYARQHEWSFDMCASGITNALRTSFLRRSMTTKVRLPDGRLVSPGDELPGAVFRTVHIRYPPDLEIRYQTYFNSVSDKLYVPAEPSKHPGTGGEDQHRMRMNPKYWRLCDIIGVNMNNMAILNVEEPATDLTIQRDRATKGKKAIESGEDDHPSSASPSHSRPRHTMVAGGVEETEQLNLQADSGRNSIFTRTRRDDRCPMPGSRLARIAFMVAESPALAYVARKIHEWKNGPIEQGLPNRVVVMVDTPWVQKELVLLLRESGLRVLDIRSKQTEEERAAILEKFNDRNSDVDVLVPNQRTGSTGIDIQYACCRGIILGYPWSAALMRQMLGRLPRIGQPRFVTWEIITITGTIAEKKEMRMWRKHVRELAAMSVKALEPLHGEWGILAAYETIRIHYQQPCNLYLCDNMDPDIGSFNDETVQQYAGALSLMARWAMQHPVSASRIQDRGAMDLFAAAVKIREEMLRDPAFTLEGKQEWIAREADIRKFEPEKEPRSRISDVVADAQSKRVKQLDNHAAIVEDYWNGVAAAEEKQMEREERAAAKKKKEDERAEAKKKRAEAKKNAASGSSSTPGSKPGRKRKSAEMS